MKNVQKKILGNFSLPKVSFTKPADVLVWTCQFLVQNEPLWIIELGHMYYVLDVENEPLEDFFYTSFDIQFRLLWALETKGNFRVAVDLFSPTLDLFEGEKKLSWFHLNN